LDINIIGEIVFISVLLLLINSYILYFPIIKIVSLFCKNKKNKSQTLPDVSVIISAYNEESVIYDRIINLLELDYPKDKMEVLIGSDGSTDKTNDILNSFSKKYTNIKSYIFPNNRGKAEVLNDLVAKASNEILIFTDANTVFDKNALKFLVEGYYDNSVGGISGKLILKDNLVSATESVEEKQYWEIETNIKEAEGKCGILIGANGGIFSIRKKLFNTIPVNKPVTDDLFISLNVLSKGYKFIFVHNAFATEDVGINVKTEYERKVRFAATNFQTLFFFKNLLFNSKPILSYAFWSHKVIRWFSPVLLLLLFLFNVLLFNSSLFFNLMMYLQIIMYTLALIGYLFTLINIKIKIFSLPFFFVITMIAFFNGFIRFLRKKHSIKWEPTIR